jgi:hypothetical protein
MTFLQAGQVREARQLAEPLAAAREAGDEGDPLARVALGYVLLASHELGPWSGWPGELPVDEDWLPDAFVVAAEWFAAGGHHLTASRHLAQLVDVGMPVFTYGYERALGRLRLYSEPTPASRRDRARRADTDARTRASQQLGPWDRIACQRTLARLLEASPSIDLDRPTVTIRRATTKKRKTARRPLSRAPLIERLDRIGTTSAKRNRRSKAMSEQDGAQDGGGGEEQTPVRGIALIAAIVALVLWAGFTAYMITKAGTDKEVTWTRLAWLFASVEAVAFAAAGAIWGTTVNRQRAEAAEKRADANAADAANGRALASSQIAEGGEIADVDTESALQRMGGGAADRGKVEVLQRHAKQARMLFPDL